MKEVCHNVSREPPLQPLSRETLSYSTAGTESARLDVAADEFWGILCQRDTVGVKKKYSYHTSNYCKITVTSTVTSTVNSIQLCYFSNDHYTNVIIRAWLGTE